MHHRNRFDLNQPLRTNQAADNHERARRWILSVDVPVADFPDLWDLCGVDAIDTVKIELDDVVKIASGGFNGRLQVLKTCSTWARKSSLPTKLPAASSAT